MNRCDVVQNPDLPGMLRGWNTLDTSTDAYSPAQHSTARDTSTTYLSSSERLSGAGTRATPCLADMQHS